MSDWKVIIGLEIHVQARTESKVFCTCKNTYGEAPNTNVCPVCLAHPGILPVVNQEAINQIVKAGLMTDSDIARYSKFDRKSYFYPDQPKNFQITQFDLPFCANGRIPIGGKGLSGKMIEERYVGMERIHLEEDVGKSTHFDDEGYSIVDYNRAGIPLLETVSMPEMHSADEAYAYVQSLQQIMRYGGISDCDQEKGQFRCDVNISVHKPGTPFNTKIEIKNLNSTRHIWLSANYEIERQIEHYENHPDFMTNPASQLKQETRRWNDELQKTVHMRFKETADDYRYFPEPDLPPVVLTDENIEEFKKIKPMTPLEYRAKFTKDFGVTDYDAHVLTLDKETADFFMEAASKAKNPKGVANVMMNQLNSLLSKSNQSLGETKLEPQHVIDLVNLAEAKSLNKKSYVEILPTLIEDGGSAEAVAKSMKLFIEAVDNSVVEGWVDDAINNNSKAVEEYKAGKGAALNSLMGQVMKASRGQASAPDVIKLLKEKLGN